MASASTSAPTAKPAQQQDWDKVMLAMDVVDTLRHQEAELDRLVNQQTDDKALVERVKNIYQAQGITVEERVIRDAVTAIKEERFNYNPPQRGFKRKLAEKWVTRKKWRKKATMVGAAAAIFGTVIVADQVHEAGADERLQELVAQASVIAQTPAAKSAIENAASNARIALALDDGTANEKIAQLEALTAVISQSYRLRIVSSPGEQSAVFRYPPNNRSQKNHYLIVDAVGMNGKPLDVHVQSEEDNSSEQRSRFAVRVSEQAYEAVKRDKLDDGIIQNNIVGEKAAGALKPQYRMDSSGAVIFEW